MGNVISEFGRLVLGVGRDIQCTEMPDYTSVDPGIIVQYTGATNANYINGYFYKCTSSGWVQENVQPETNISEKQDKSLATPLDINGTQETTVEGALGGLNDYGNALKTAISNENLLLNPFFTVNQANNTSGTLNNAFVGSTLTDDWFIDRGAGTLDGTYSISGGVVTIANTNSTATCYHSQGMTKDLTENKTATISIELSDGSIVSDVIKPNASSKAVYVYDSNNVLIATVTYNRNQYRFNIVVEAGKTLAYKAVKLELGEMSTLANDVAPNQTVETIKCQRADFRSVSSIQATGSTNKTGAIITNGTFFYLNGQFCKAIADIAVNATFTENTNYKKDTVGSEIETLNTSLSGLSVTVASGTFKNTQVDTYEDTGITFQALGAHLHVVLTSWISGKPTGLKVVATDNSDMVYETTGTYAECLVFANVETKTFRLYSKRGSIPSSPNSFTVKRINL